MLFQRDLDGLNTNVPYIYTSCRAVFKQRYHTTWCVVSPRCRFVRAVRQSCTCSVLLLAWEGPRGVPLKPRALHVQASTRPLPPSRPLVILHPCSHSFADMGCMDSTRPLKIAKLEVLFNSTPNVYRLLFQRSYVIKTKVSSSNPLLSTLMCHTDSYLQNGSVWLLKSGPLLNANGSHSDPHSEQWSAGSRYTTTGVSRCYTQQIKYGRHKMLSNKV